MKKTLFAISAIAVLLGFTACTSENEILEPQVSGNTITIKASTEMPDPSTRTMLDLTTGSDDAGYPVLWTAGDKIKLANETTFSEFTLDNNYANNSTGEFTGPSLTEGNYTAYYPADYDGTNWPTTQTYTANNITGSPMMATFTYSTGEDPFLAFKNVGGILRLNLKLEEGSSDSRSVSKIVVSSTQLDKDIELNCATAVALSDEDVPFHIAVPAKEYTDLKFTIYDNEGYKCTKTLKSDKSIKVERSQITPVNLTAKSWDYAGLCFTAEEASSVRLNKKNSPTEVTLQTSSDGTVWSDYTFNTDIKLAVGEKVYFRNKSVEVTQFSTSTSNYYYFSMTGSIAASGNVMSLIDSDCNATVIPSDYCFYYLFYGCSGLTTAPELPATTLANYCYRNMFDGCKKLTTAPELPATTLANYCYQYMFNSCISLETALELPATTLANYCYQNMFYNCTSLATAPELPATTLASLCYQYMFSGCTSLETAPELPATTLAQNCYAYMFYGCTSLNSVTCLATDNSASNCVSNWLYNTTTTGTLYCESGKKDIWKDKVPTGWTVEEK